MHDKWRQTKAFINFKKKNLLKEIPAQPSDVIVRANEKGWMSQEIFLDWLNEVWKKEKVLFFKNHVDS